MWDEISIDVSIPQIGEICIRFISQQLIYYLSFLACFNPLDRGNLYQIGLTSHARSFHSHQRFNPLNRGNLYQIEDWDWAIQSVLAQVSIPQIGEICIRCYKFSIATHKEGVMFQSPGSGKIVSDQQDRAYYNGFNKKFQSPRSGKFVSDFNQIGHQRRWRCCFNPLDRGNLYQIPRRYCYMGTCPHVSIPQIGEICIRYERIVQSLPWGRYVSIPQIGEICIRFPRVGRLDFVPRWSFNPLDRGNLYQIAQKTLVN